MSFNYEYLLDQTHIDFAKQTVGNNNESLTYYIDTNIGFQYLDRYYPSTAGYVHNVNAINIKSIGTFAEDQTFIRDLFQKLDPIIDLDFVEMSHNNGSLIDIYSISYSSNFSTDTVGMSIKQEIQNGSWFDVLWLSTSDYSLNSFDKNTITHELSHALGLSHPNDDPQDKRWTSENTIMSYNKGPNDWDYWFSDDDIFALKKIWGRENDSGIMNFNKNFEEYNFYQSSDKKYSIESHIGKEDITGMKKLNFKNKTIDIKTDIEGVFDQITGIEDITGKMFRLYNSAFSRFPDADGLRYWIRMNQTKENSYRQTCASFIISDEFINKYGQLISNELYINTLYSNILDRQADNDGFQYWLSQLNKGIETRGEILMGFSESAENVGIFKEILGYN